MKKPTKPPAKDKKAPAPTKAPVGPTHKQRFEQLLDDVVRGVPPKR